MAYSTSVKYFHSGMAGAPSLSGTAGTLLAVLDACLVNGFGSQTATISVASGVATVVLSNVSSNPFDGHTVASVSGATTTAINGEKRVLTKTGTGFTFDATGVSDGAIGGSISVKLAAAGWEKQFSGTNLGAYRSTNVLSSRYVVRVDDSDTINTRVVGYESMTDINTGVNPCPTPTQASGGLWWPKASVANATARSWIVIADDKTLFVKINTYPGVNQESGITWTAGDFAPARLADSHCFRLTGAIGNIATSTGFNPSIAYLAGLHVGTHGYAGKSYTGVGSAVATSHNNESYGGAFTAQYYSGSMTTGYQYPNGGDNSLLLSRQCVIEAPNTLRGITRGLMTVVSQAANYFLTLEQLNGTGSMAGRKLLAVKGSTPSLISGSDGTLYFFDITGPWG